VPKNRSLNRPEPDFRSVLQAECPWLVLSDSQWGFLRRHNDLLRRWNPKLNLTATFDIRKHFGESLFLGKAAAELFGSPAAIADIGSGGGFPGLPLAIAHPDWKVTLVESDRRKAIFLREAAEGLSNVEVSTERAESLQGGFDWLVSRAVQPELVAVTAVRIAKGLAMILREVPSVAGVETTARIELPWAGTGSVWMGHVPRETHPIAG
jgi:16S rRNA (guanine527-N7)-methyltransferase